MATQRYISTSFWDDEWIQTLDPSEKLLYLYLMTNPLTNIAGVYKITIRRMCFDTGFNADTVGHILGKFEKAKKAYLHGEYIVLPSWPQHQKADDRSKIKKGIDAIIKSLPANIVEYMVLIGYRYHIEGYTYHLNYSDIDSDIDIDIDSDSNKREKPQAASALPEKSYRFSKPTLEEVSAYCAERSNGINAQSFIDYYESNGWKVGRSAMKDWRAAVRNWERREGGGKKNLRVLQRTACLDMAETL